MISSHSLLLCDWDVGVDMVLTTRAMFIKKLKSQRKKPVYWIGSPPPNLCEVSNVPILSEFVDGPSRGARGGPWGILHPSYFKQCGGTFGPSLGQLYQLQSDGRWLKIKG